MGFSRFDIVIYIRVAVLFILIGATCITYLTTDFIVTPIMFGLMAILTTVELIWRLKRMERAWSRFLLSMHHHDFSRSYREYDEFPELREAFDTVTQSFEKLSTQIAVDYQLLKTVYQHVKIGLICYRPSGEVIIANKSVLNLLQLTHLRNTHDLSADYPKLYEVLNITEGISEELISDHKLNKLLIRKEAFTIKGESYKLASIYNLTSTLEINELESYQKLLKVLTHEIMNSSAPILSLIQIVNQKLLEGEQVRTLNEKDQRNMAISLRGIEDRTSGMLNFVKAYRIVNREISPNRAMVHLDTLRNSIQGQLEGFKTQYPDANLELRIDKAVEVWIDLDLMSQVLINLIKNALEASVDQDAPQVFIDIKPHDRDLIIAVADNGEGVNADTESDIFVPFFTTKKDGSGIGLALSRKIVRAHQGQLTYSREAAFSRFEIRLADALLLQNIS